MKCKEMYDHLAADWKKVEYRKEYFKPKAIKELRKATKFPAWKWYEYETPQTRNKYVIFYYAENQNFIENPLTNSFVDIFFDKQRFVVKWGTSPYKHTPESPIKPLRILNVYSSHFLSRYNERFLKDDTLSSNDVACHYLSRNDISMPIEITEEINSNIDQYGEGGKEGFVVKDGLCFAQTGFEGLQSNDGNRNNDIIDAKIIIYTTFIPKSMMTEGQRSAVEKEHIEKWFQAYWEFMKEAKGGTLKLRLEP